MKRAPIIHVLTMPGLLLAGLLYGPVRAGDGHARTHAWSMEHGSLVSNWSFENDLETWSAGGAGGVTADPRFAPSAFAAPTGRFVGRASGTSSLWWSVRLTTDPFPVVPGETYTLSFRVRAAGAVSSGIHPALRLHGDDGSVLMVPGTAYATLSGGVLPEWTLYVRSFTLPSSGFRYRRASLALWRSGPPGETADLFFDDVVLEEGDFDSAAVAARRARHGHEQGFSDALGNVHRVLTRLDGDGASWRLDGTDFDSAGRPVRGVLPVVGGADYDPYLSASAGAYYYYTPGVPDAGGCPFAETEYAPEPGARVTRVAAPGGAWCLDGGRTAARGFRYVPTLDVPSGDGTSSAPDPHERPWRLDWTRDEDSVVTLAWSDARGRVVQTAARTGDGWAVARTEHDPAGRARRMLTPLDVAGGGDAFAEVATRDARGLVTSRYTRDRGLEVFRYNRAGRVRLRQDDRQREASPPRATYFDYDRQGRLVSTGTRDVPATLPEHVDGFGRGAGDTAVMEGRGFLYGSLDDFAARTGVPLDSVLYPLAAVAIPERDGALMAAWNANPWSRAPGFSAPERLVADLFAYDDEGRISIHYKYLGAVKDRAHRLQVTAFDYDTAGRLTERRSYDGAGYPETPIIVQGWRYDALGRVAAVTADGDTVARYGYAPRGVLDSVMLGRPESGVTVTYGHHIRGWVREVVARRNGGGTLWRQAIGYEARALEGTGVPLPTTPRYAGAPSQQVYAYGGGVSDPVRAVNYTYDPLGRLTTADSRQGTGAGGTHELVFPLALVDTDTLDTRVAFDANGRLAGKRAGGVSSADSARYVYQPGRYGPDHVTGRLAPDGARDASSPGSFRYDAAGNLVEDVSRNLAIDYAPDGLPVRFESAGGTEGGTLHLYPLYDAAGRRVSQVAARGNPSGFPVRWVGTAEAGEEPGSYHHGDLVAAWLNAYHEVSVRPSVDSVTFHVVPPAGDSARDGVTMNPIVIGGDTARVIVRGARKFGATYQAWHAERVGRPVRARHTAGVTDVRETYASDGTVTARRTAVTLEGRGASIGRQVPVDTGAVRQFYVKNHLGSTVMVVDAAGGVSAGALFDYLPQGEMKALRSDTLNPVGPTFTGKELDSEVNLYYFGARWYDPELGLWISPDPARQYANPYLYAGGSPLAFYDPDGLWSLGLGVVFGHDERGWHIGFGVAADFRKETGFGANTSRVWHEDGTRTTTVGGTVGLPVGNVVVYNGASYSHNSRDGHSAGAVAGVAHADGAWGAEIGTNHSWDNDGRYRGGNAYAQAYAGYGSGARATGGYAVGWGSYDSGPYARLGVAGFSWSADRHGVRYNGFAEDASVGYRSDENGRGIYVDYPGKEIVDYMTSKKVAGGGGAVDPTHVPDEEFLTAVFGTNWCGRGNTAAHATGRLDQACRAHDKRYGDGGAKDVNGALVNRDPQIVAADIMLAGSAFASMGESTWRGFAVGATFSVIGGYKMASHLGGPSGMRNQWY